MGASQYDADSLYLVLAYFACKPCCIEAVLYGFRPVTDSFRELDKFTVEVSPLRVGIFRLDGALDVCRHSAVCALCFL